MPDIIPEHEGQAKAEKHPRYTISFLPASGKKRNFWRDNGLTLVALGLFLACWLGQIVTGWHEYNQDQLSHHQATVGMLAYLTTGHFWEITMENWESEFLQMGLFVVFTSWLFQRGSAESKDPDQPHDEKDREMPVTAESPGPIRRGGWMAKLYEHSLSIALLGMFALFFLLHASQGAREYSQEQIEHGQAAVSMLQYMGTPRFWFESFQNWQSEFLAVAMLTILSIFLRERGSSQSKPVEAPHQQTGQD